jgi:hypothetical protein
MSCSGVGGVGQNPYQFLQASSAQKSATDTSTTSDTTANGAAAVAQLQQQLQAQGQSGAHHHHHHGGGGGKNSAGSGDAVANLLNTIQQALQSADSSDDPNKVIQDTVTKLLSGTPQTNSTNTTASDPCGTATTTAATPTDAQQSFADVLKSHGVDFQQFRADLLTAVKNAQNGQINAGTALKSFAPGSTVDLSA